MTGFVVLASSDELPQRASRVVAHGGQKVLLVRLDGDEVRAYDANCPHAKGTLADGPLVEDELVECPMHGAFFRADDGSLDPASPITCAGLTSWPVRVDGGQIAVDVPEKRLEDRGAGRPMSWGSFGGRPATGTTEA